MIEFTHPASQADLEQILALQEKNLVASISAETRASQGFVTVKHTLPLLTEMNEAAPQIIAKAENKVVGYALVMLKEFQDKVPVLKPMFTMLSTLQYLGQLQADCRYYVMGQICVDEAFRGQGIFDGLYQKHKEVYSPVFDVCITEISSSNTRSLKAHHRVGFKTIHTFKDMTDNWEIVSWDWS